VTDNNSFYRDVGFAKEQLESAQHRSHLIKLFTLGFFDGRSKVIQAQQAVDTAIRQYEQYQLLSKQAALLDDELLQYIEIEGVRISQNVFSDLPTFGHADYPPNWKELRQSILQRDNFACQEADGNCQGPLQIHHIIPLSKGGTNVENNLITICLYHHCNKHPHMMAKYYGNTRR